MQLGAFFFEILPLAGFFIAFHYLGLLPAAAISVGLGLLVLLVARLRERVLQSFTVPLMFLLCSRWQPCSLMRCLSNSANPVQRGVCGNPVSWPVLGQANDAGVLRRPV